MLKKIVRLDQTYSPGFPGFDSSKNTYVSSRREAEEVLAQFEVLPGWVVHFLQDGFTYHCAMVLPSTHGSELNAFDAQLLHCSPPPHGTHGEFTLNGVDISGIRIQQAMDYASRDYIGIYVGPPPGATDEMLRKAGEIAADVAKTGILENEVIVYSIPLLKISDIAFIDQYEPEVDKTNFRLKYPVANRIKKEYGYGLKTAHCGQMVGEIWELAGVPNIPQTLTRVGFNGYTNYELFNWSMRNYQLYGVIWGMEKPTHETVSYD